MEVKNTPPSFESKIISNIDVKIFENKKITLPKFEDKEGNLPIKVTTFQKGKQNLPKFVKFNPKLFQYDIQPQMFDKEGIYMISVILEDSLEASTTENFAINVLPNSGS